MQNKNHIFLQLKKITEVTTLSFLLFYILLPGISTNLYLGIYATAILILYFAAGDYRNTEILQEFLTAGVFATIGFFISKLANGCTMADIWNNKSWFRFLLLETCVEEYMVQTAIKRGPMLRHMDARMITNPHYQRYALDLAEKLGIPVQDAVRSAGATNGAAIHLTEKAVPVIVIGVPVRYAHTHYGISAYADFDNAVKLACEILKRLDEEQIMSF